MHILTILNVSSVKSFLYSLYKKCVLSILSERVLLDITIPNKVLSIPSEEVNKYPLILIFGFIFDSNIQEGPLPKLRNKYTGKIIGLHTLINGYSFNPFDLTLFDKVYIQSESDLSYLRSLTNYSYANYIPSPLCLIKTSRPTRKNTVKIGLIIPRVNEEIIKKLSLAVDNLISEGYNVLGISLSPEDLPDLQAIQRACPVFMIYAKRNIIREIMNCSCLIAGTYESFWIGLCIGIPIIPVPFDRSYELLANDATLPTEPVVRSPKGDPLMISSKSLKKKVIKSLQRTLDRQTDYLIKNRFILSSICPLFINQIIEDYKSDIIDHVSQEIRLPDLERASYYVSVRSKGDFLWKKVTNKLYDYNQHKGIFIDPDIYDNFREKGEDKEEIKKNKERRIYLFEWIGILRCNIEELKYLLTLKNFIGSLNTCRHIFVFSEEMSKILRKELSNINLNTDISVIFFPYFEDHDYKINLNSTNIIGKDINIDYNLQNKDNINLENKETLVIFTDEDATYQGYLTMCISKGIPFLLKRSLTHVSFLGERYPLYFNDIPEISSLMNKIPEAKEYLSNFLKSNRKFDLITFVIKFESVILSYERSLR